jgi:hypothetical protein
MAIVRCPTCFREFAPEQTNTMPFCSVRCQQIDLGGWLNEEIGLPIEPDEEADGAERN